MPTSPSQLKRGYKLHRRSRTKFHTEESAIEHVRMKTQRPIKKYTTHHTAHAWVFREPLTNVTDRGRAKR